MKNPTAQYFRTLTVSQQKMWDAPYFSIIQQCNGHLDRMLYSFFHFLHRHSDLYVIPDQYHKSNSSFNMGFPPGDAENLILNIFHQFDYQTEKSKLKVLSKNFSKTLKNKTKPKENKCIVPNGNVIKYSSNGKQIPINNGGTNPNYTWSQTLHEVNVNVPVISTSNVNDIVVTIQSNFISVELKSQVLLKGNIEFVKKNECTWSYEGNELIIILEKKVETWWESIFCDDKEEYKIDTSFIESTRTISEYDDETRRIIEKNMYEKRKER